MQKYKRRLFLKITSKSFPIFQRGGDIISVNTQILGIHKPVITSLISSWAKNGYNDFLLDIGANIGCISC